MKTILDAIIVDAWQVLRRRRVLAIEWTYAFNVEKLDADRYLADLVRAQDAGALPDGLRLELASLLAERARLEEAIARSSATHPIANRRTRGAA